MTSVKLSDGHWRLYYHDQMAEIVSASSVNGLSFIPDPVVRIPSSASPVSNVAAPTVLQLSNDTWLIVYQSAPPASLEHTYRGDGIYQATLIVFPSPPFTVSAAKFLTTASISVGDNPEPVVNVKVTPPSGKAPVKVVFQIDPHFAKPTSAWSIDFGDGLSNTGTGKPPHFAGHTYTTPGSYTVVIALINSASSSYVTVATVKIT